MTEEEKLGYGRTGVWMLAGLAPSWIVIDGIFAQIARLNRSQPEGLALATYLGAVSAFANSFVVPLYEKLRLWYGGSLAAWSSGVAWSQVFSCVLAAATWNLHYGGCSLFLYIVMFMSSLAGNGQQLALVPWLAHDESRAIAPVMAGGQSGVLFAAGLVAFQDEALKATGFFGTPSFFFLFMAFLLTFSCLAIRIARYDLDATKSKHQMTSPQHNPIINRIPPEAGTLPEEEEENNSKEDQKESETSTTNHVDQTSSIDDEKTTILNRLGLKAISAFCPPLSTEHSSQEENITWLPLARLIAWSNASLQLVSWVLVRSALPFAFRYARPISAGKDGGAYLEVGVNGSLVACFIGAVLATRTRVLSPATIRPWRVNYILAFASLYIIAILLFASPPLHSKLPALGLIAAAAIVRALDGFYSPLYYRALFDLSKSSTLVKNAGELAILVVMLGVWLALLLVLLLS